MELTSEELVRFRAGDPELFRRLVERYQTGLWQLCRRMTRDPEEAWDLTQECFLRIYRKSEMYDPSYPLTPWIYQVATRVVLNRLERRRKEEPMSSVGVAEPADPRPAATEPAERDETSARVAAALDRLSPSDALLLRLRYLGELSVEEVARALGLSVQAVKTRLFRARARLKDVLGTDLA